MKPVSLLSSTRLVRFALALLLITLPATVGCSSSAQPPSATAEVQQRDSANQTAAAAAKQPAEPAAAPLPEPQQYVVERIGTYVKGDYISSNLGGYTVRQYVSVKFKGEDEVRAYSIDALWILVRPDDVVVFTPSRQGGEIVWTHAVYFQQHPKTLVEQPLN